MAQLEDPEVQDLLAQLNRTSHNTAIVTGIASFTALMGGILVALGHLMPTIPFAAVIAVGCGIVYARETRKSVVIRDKIQSIMFPKKN